MPLPCLARAHAAVPARLFLAGITRIPAVVPALAVRLHRQWVPRVRVPIGVRLFGLAVRGLHQGHHPGMVLAPDSLRCRSSSCSHSPLRCTDEDRQEKQSSLYFVGVVAHVESVSDLPEAP